MIRIRPFLLAACALLLAAIPARAQDEFLPQTTPVELATGEPDVAIGELIFRGGVEIAPDKAGIGGISGLEWHDGVLYAVSDNGRWLMLTPEDVAGRLVDVSSITIGDLRDLRGGKLKGDFVDAEAITRTATGEWLIAFERQNRIWRYAAPGAVPTPSGIDLAGLLAGARLNAEIETMAAYDGGLLVCGEWADAARPNCRRITAGGTEAFHLAAPAGIAEFRGAPTDAACRADGSACFVLFRSYTPSAPARQRNRAAIVKVAADNSAETLAVLAPPMVLDNFEGLALREERGRTFLYIVSDDNFGNCANSTKPDCQHTYLLKFEVKGPPPAADEPIIGAAPTPDTARPGTRPFPAAASITVVLQTELGAITIALETERAPVTARNFLRYVDDKRFNGTVFYRAMHLDREPRPNGLLQGGTQWDPKRILPGIAHEPTTTTGLSHTHGAVSMAMGAPGSANGDFSIMIEDQTGLDADPAASDPVWRSGFAVFGYVVDGMDVVAAIHAGARDPAKGDGVMKGQMLAKPLRIISARRAAPLPPQP
jgi:cyclophilin family peptidyl-prolyl cis-trans isomerase